jgi:hypothetical protein
MTVTLNLAESIARELAARALAHGLPIDAYAVSIIEHAVSPVPLPPQRQIGRREFAAALDAMAQYSKKIPVMPGETFSREMIYQDHD